MLLMLQLILRGICVDPSRLLLSRGGRVLCNACETVRLSSQNQSKKAGYLRSVKFKTQFSKNS